MALFARVMHDAFGRSVDDWQQIVAFRSVLSMFIGGVQPSDRQISNA
jgi:NADH-quinone oxidoreductase subunit N